MALRSDAFIADISLSPSRTKRVLSTNREKIGMDYSLKRDDTTPLIVITRVRDTPSDISTLSAYST
jgi:hypothetical protein